MKFGQMIRDYLQQSHMVCVGQNANETKLKIVCKLGIQQVYFLLLLFLGEITSKKTNRMDSKWIRNCIKNQKCN